MNRGFKRLAGLLDILMVDAQMKRQKGFDIKLYASIENAKKCLENADRLLGDALKTSLPTRVALLELGIEEISKGLIILFNMDLQHKNSDIQDFIMDTELPDNLKQQCLEEIETITSIKNLNPYDHGEKLKALKSLFDFVSRCYPVLIDFVYIGQLSQLLNGMNIGNIDIPITTDLLEKIKNIKVSKWDRVKEDSLYVNLENGNAIPPEKRDLKAYSSDILMVFIVARSVLSIYLLLYEDKDLKAIFSNPKAILGPFYDIIVNSSKEK